MMKFTEILEAIKALNTEIKDADLVMAWPTAQIAVMGASGAVNIISPVKKEIKEAEERQNAEIDRYFATFEGLTFKEKIAQKKENPEAEAEHLQRIAETQEEITNGKLKLKLMQNNAKISLFNEVMPIVLEVLQY